MQKLPIIINSSENSSQLQQNQRPSSNLNNSSKRRSSRKLAQEAETNSTMDSYGNTNIEIKLSDSNAKLNSKKFANNNSGNRDANNMDVNLKNQADLTDNDDINTPFTKDSDLAINEDNIQVKTSK
jgi:hypothetical protein